MNDGGHMTRTHDSDAIRAILRKTADTPGIEPHFDADSFDVNGITTTASAEMLAVLQAWSACGRTSAMHVRLGANQTCVLTCPPSTRPLTKIPCRTQGEIRRPNPWNGYNAVSTARAAT